MKCRFNDSLVLRLTVVLAVIFAISLGEASGKEKGVLVVAGVPSVGNLDPSSSGSSINVMMYRSIFQGLTRYKYNSTALEGELAKSWSVSKDGLVYTFKLRDNVNWHKSFGKVTAEDVKFSFDRILDPKTGSQFLGDLEMVEEVKVIDDLTVEVHLKKRDVTFVNKCVVKPLAIVCKKAVEQYGKDFSRNPIGSGPYVFESMSREEVVLTANKEYYEGAPKIEKVIYKAIPDIDTMVMALIKGEVDLIHGLLPDNEYFSRIKAGGSIPK
jgi:ABC-type transport system substrate-binding protein